MGVGGVTALGCTVGQGLSGISTLALGSFITVAAIMAGAVAGAALPGLAPGPHGVNAPPRVQEDTLERRFGGLRRLHGDAGYARLRALRVAVVGLGGVGSWTVEALARSGVAGLVLVDYDHVAESNINRQVQALGRTLGQAKGQALRERIADIHPGCRVEVVDEFAGPRKLARAAAARRWTPSSTPATSVRAKAHLAAWARATACRW
jgi:tRNA A37 threonylcarbamoyladenosine dehydratase